jgi:hypothetical protein
VFIKQPISLQHSNNAAIIQKAANFRKEGQEKVATRWVVG